MSCEYMSDYLYYCITAYVIVTCYLIKYQEKQETFLKKRLAEERELTNHLLYFVQTPQSSDEGVGGAGGEECLKV